jgi:hypothetical protein
MGQQPSKAVPAARAEAPLNEKRVYSGSPQATLSESKIAAYSRSTDASAGLALDKLKSWQQEFDDVSILRARRAGPSTDAAFSPVSHQATLPVGSYQRSSYPGLGREIDFDRRPANLQPGAQGDQA